MALCESCTRWNDCRQKGDRVLLKCTLNSSGEHHSFDDKPAIEWTNGDKMWCSKGKWHREDGPALEYAKGGKEWLLHGKHHREDGPAAIGADGERYWYFNDKESIKVLDQDIIVGGKVEVGKDVGLVLKEVEENIYLVLVGNQKRFIERG